MNPLVYRDPSTGKRFLNPNALSYGKYTVDKRGIICRIVPKLSKHERRVLREAARQRLEKVSQIKENAQLEA